MATKQTAAILKPSSKAGSAAATQAGGAVATVSSKGAGAVALPSDLMAELAQAAKAVAATERPKISKLSFRGGILQYMKQEIPDNRMNVIIMASAQRNTWYAGAWDPDNIVNPNCFAIALQRPGEKVVMVPHENVKEPVHESCEGCPKNQWGTAMRDGKPSRGKACKEGRRLIIMPADALEAGAEGVKNAELAIADIPVTSVNNWAVYVNAVATTVNRPYWGVITTLELARHRTNTFEVKFTPIDVVEDEDTLRAIMARIEECDRLATTPFDETELMGKSGEKVLAPAKTVNKSKFTK